MEIKKNIKAIIFDLGGVIYDIDIDNTARVMKSIGVNVDEIFSTSEQKDVFDKIDKGLIGAKDFFQSLREYSAQEHLSDAAILDAWNTCLVNLPKERLECLMKVREYYPIYLLSNTNEMHWNLLKERDFPYKGLKVEELFNKLFLSFEMHVHKPDKEIFEQVASALPFKPEECFFIDDSSANVRAAQDMGFMAHQEPSNSGEWMKLFESLK